MKVLVLDHGFEVVRPTGELDLAPKWNKLFPLGSRHRDDFPSGRIDFTPKFLATMVENWKRMGSAALPADYLHRGDIDGDLPVEQKVASGWIEDLELRDDGLYGLIRWTKRAREYIAADELRYLSPTFSTEAIDRSTGKPQGPTLYGCALLNTPFLTDLPRVAASAVAVPPAQPQPAPRATEKQMNKLICAALGLPGDSTEEAIVAAVTKAQAALAVEPKLSAEKEEAVKLAASSGAGVEALKIALAKESSERTALSAEVTALQTAARDTAVQIEADKLFSAGKLPGKDTESFRKVALAMGLPEAISIFGGRAPVPMTEEGHGKDEKPVSGDALQAKYDAEFDALLKAGSTTAAAVHKLGRTKEFIPLFNLNASAN